MNTKATLVALGLAVALLGGNAVAATTTLTGTHVSYTFDDADLGQTLSDYLLAELERLAARPTREEMLARIHSRKRATLKTPAATDIREEGTRRRGLGRAT